MDWSALKNYLPNQAEDKSDLQQMIDQKGDEAAASANRPGLSTLIKYGTATPGRYPVADAAWSGLKKLWNIGTPMAAALDIAGNPDAIGGDLASTVAHMPGGGPGMAAITMGGKKLSPAAAQQELEKIIERAKNNEFLYHGTDAKAIKKIATEGLEPRVGTITKSAYGEYLDPHEYPGVVQPAVFMDERPGYLKWSAENIKPTEIGSRADRDLMRKDLKHSGLAVVDKDNSNIYKYIDESSGSGHRYTNTSGEEAYPDFGINEHTGRENSHPINIEPTNYFSMEHVTPEYTITEPELGEFLKRTFPKEYPLLVDKSKLAARKNALKKMKNLRTKMNERQPKIINEMLDDILSKLDD